MNADGQSPFAKRRGSDPTTGRVWLILGCFAGLFGLPVFVFLVHGIFGVLATVFCVGVIAVCVWICAAAKVPNLAKYGAVAVVLFAMLSTLLAAGILHSRETARRARSVDQLRELGAKLSTYRELHRNSDSFPIPPENVFLEEHVDQPMNQPLAASHHTDPMPKPKSERRKPAVALIFSKHYDVDLGGLERQHAFDIHKHATIHRQLIKDGLVSEKDFHEPEPLSREQMLLVHTEQFIAGLDSPETVALYLEAPPVRFLPAAVVDKQILRAFRYASGGTILAARLALRHGIAVNLGGGYHHAKPNQGEGFCVYADMPIAIRILKREKLIRRALVVDLDVHQGNGTIVCFADDPTVFTFSMHQRDIYPMPKEKGDLDIELAPGTDDDAYMRILRSRLPGVIDRAEPEVVLLQAGCDTLQGDPLAELEMTKDGVVERDAHVIDTCAKRGIPVAMLLGGGYSKQAWTVQHASIARTVRKYGVLRRPSDDATTPGKNNPKASDTRNE